MSYLIPIIIGSERDSELAKTIKGHLQKLI